jgi:hypothetical protein
MINEIQIGGSDLVLLMVTEALRIGLKINDGARMAIDTLTLMFRRPISF